MMSFLQKRCNRGTEEGFTNMEKTRDFCHSSIRRPTEGQRRDSQIKKKQENYITPPTKGQRRDSQTLRI
jgi:hypothetical protein